MLGLKTKKELSQDAHTLARGYQLVRHRGITYMPADYETGDMSVTPAPERTIWLPLNRAAVQRLAAQQFDTLFSSDGELSSFEFMVAQQSMMLDEQPTSLLVRTLDGLKELKPDGKLHEPAGVFIPNTLVPMLDETEEEKSRVFDVIAGWLDSEEEAHSLLMHLATSMSPGWSAVKYIILLGEGRNGKSVLMKMLQHLYGWSNVSHVTRQEIADGSPVVCELNGKLLNVVFDGMSKYVSDSGMEKSLIAGEPVSIRKLYESTPTPVQTNALFVEGLNREPKSTDKSLALQKRIMRFHFPNVYSLDHKFEKQMLAPDSLGAFMALLLDHYVLEEDVAEKLAPTQVSMELQLEHMFSNSLGLQYLKYLDETDALGIDGLINVTMGDLATGFQSWRVRENDVTSWSEPDVQALFQSVLNTDRRSIRIGGQPRKARVVTSFKAEALAFIATLKGDKENGTTEDEILGDLDTPEQG